MDERFKRLPDYNSETCTLEEAVSKLRQELEKGGDMIWIAFQIEDLAVNPKFEEWEAEDEAFFDFYNAAVAYMDVVDPIMSKDEAAEVIKKYLTR